MSTRERLVALCALAPGETRDETDRYQVPAYLGDLRRLLAVLDEAACIGVCNHSDSLEGMIDDLLAAVDVCSEEEP